MLNPPSNRWDKLLDRKRRPLTYVERKSQLLDLWLWGASRPGGDSASNPYRKALRDLHGAFEELDTERFESERRQVPGDAFNSRPSVVVPFVAENEFEEIYNEAARVWDRARHAWRVHGSEGFAVLRDEVVSVAEANAGVAAEAEAVFLGTVKSCESKYGAELLSFGLYKWRGAAARLELWYRERLRVLNDSLMAAAPKPASVEERIVMDDALKRVWLSDSSNPDPQVLSELKRVEIELEERVAAANLAGFAAAVMGSAAYQAAVGAWTDFPRRSGPLDETDVASSDLSYKDAATSGQSGDRFNRTLGRLREHKAPPGVLVAFAVDALYDDLKPEPATFADLEPLVRAARIQGKRGEPIKMDSAWRGFMRSRKVVKDEDGAPAGFQMVKHDAAAIRADAAKALAWAHREGLM